MKGCNVMSKIDKIFDIWSDLEKSYSALGKGKSRSEFMKSLVGYKSLGNHGINYILKNLSDELDNDKSNMDKFSLLTETLKILSNYLDVEGIPVEIDNLNAFLVNACGMSKDSLTEDDIYSMYIRNKFPKYEITYKQMIKRFSCIDNYVELVKDKNNKRKLIPMKYVGIENVFDKVKVFKKHMVYDYIMSNSKSEDKFTLDCLKVLSILIQTDNLGEVVCISDQSNIENSKIFGVEMRFNELITYYNSQIVEFELAGTKVYCLC